MYRLKDPKCGSAIPKYGYGLHFSIGIIGDGILGNARDNMLEIKAISRSLPRASTD
jgi:hypothetical protein